MTVERLERIAGGIISLADAKDHCRIGEGISDFDAMLRRMCITAALEFEDYAQIALQSQAIRLTLPHWPSTGGLPLPIGPVLSPESITVFAGDEEFSNWTLNTGLRAELQLTADRPAGRIMVEYIAGYGADSADLPADIRHALLDQAAVFFETPAGYDGRKPTLSPHFARIAARYRGVRV